mmetsp:Transcript_12549/g.18829  ORF Transcript_12549/g.18829 Transcript_12549/m.18829 type:complete len:198 (-) Transcript_12549:306-899(-)|eukprot:CAMPEP_0196820644 /NCGR_PEP_ID=MMETSP1362-20130617/76182_1 /TAXON_ID=163516 /ORGANISM="Leptocylindrus danicus, Strain CCMP1856" /LENGTH=197 /DNA_ID=CAMNT_0042199607 /DNA_START=286 /DNA_END=879 /DNA_ORIENTATION=-
MKDNNCRAGGVIVTTCNQAGSTHNTTINTHHTTEEIPHLIGYLDEDSNLEVVLADCENSRDEAVVFYKKWHDNNNTKHHRRSFPSTESLQSYANDDVMEYRSTRFFCTSASSPRSKKRDQFFQKQFEAFDAGELLDDSSSIRPFKGEESECSSTKYGKKQGNDCDYVCQHHFLEFLPDDPVDSLPEISSSFDSELMC